MEAIYIGTNAIAANPDTYVQDGIADTMTVAGIKPTQRTGSANQTTNMTAFINKPAGVTSVDYKWEYKKSADTTWVMGRDWTNGTTGKTYGFTPDTGANYDIKVTIRDNANQGTAINPYVLSAYIVKQTQDTVANTIKPSTGIQHCRRILLLWDWLTMYGDDINPYQLYISDLTNPTYFPTTNTVSFDTGKLEPITSVIRFRDMLIIFTKSTIQTLTGHTPEDYVHSLINDVIGCIAERSAVVTGNTVTFLSSEGAASLKPNQFILEVLNVSRVDVPIHTEILNDTKNDAVGMLYNTQYWLYFPSSKEVFRMYYENDNIWVRDASTKLNIADVMVYGTDVYELSTDGTLYLQDRTRFDDDGEAYEMVAEGKFLDLTPQFQLEETETDLCLSETF